MSSVILADAWLITMNGSREVLPGTGITIRDDRVVAVGPRDEMVAADPEGRGGRRSGHNVMPGMVNTRTHLFQTLLKGLGDDMLLTKWFTCVTAPSAVALTPGAALRRGGQPPTCLGSASPPTSPGAS
jgi:5-methylthioadenosine/S-adenosylhomocysteine deaminase